MVRVLFLIQPHLHEKLPLAKPLAISKMARCSKKQKLAVILRRKRLLQRCFFHFEKSSFLVKTVLLKKIHKLDVAYEEYNRNPRRVGRKRSTDWLQSHFVSLGDWSTKWLFVVVVTHMTGMRTYKTRRSWVQIPPWSEFSSVLVWAHFHL